MNRLQLTLFVLVATVMLAPPFWGTEPNWPGWRGPNRTDVTSETGFLKEWPKAGPRRVWLFDNCGVGFSGPAIVGDCLYIMGARDGKERILALNSNTGDELWDREIDKEWEQGRGNGPRSTPTVAGDRVYALSANGRVVCLKRDDGKELWNVSLVKLGGTPPNWGYCESVLVDRGRMICTPGGPQGAIVALNANSGKVEWQSTKFTEPAQYASPQAIELNGARQYVQLTMKSIVGVDANNGKVIWRSDWPGATAVITTPIIHDNQVYVTSGYGVGCKLVKIDTQNKTSDVYFNKRMKNQHGGVILLDGKLYGYSDKIGWVCQDFNTGKLVWSEKKALGKGSIAYADGRFYCFSENEGTVVLIDASPEGWKERGRFTLTLKSKLRQPRWLIWTHPVVTGGRLFLRNQELLFCFDVGA